MTLQVVALVVIGALAVAWVGACAYVYRYAVRAEREFKRRNPDLWKARETLKDLLDNRNL